MYTIFNNQVPIFLTDSLEKLEEDSFYYKDDITIGEVLTKTGSGLFNEIYIYSPDLKSLWKEFKWYFKIEKAAGGLVVNRNEEVLFIYRFDTWDLPKGKIEKGESKKEAAIREVEEECGVSGLEIDRKLQNTYHLFERKGRNILKITYWYAMTTDFDGVLVPQEEEGITQVVFKNADEIEKALENTYENIKLLFQ